MSVGNYNPSEFGRILFDIGKIGNDKINPEHFAFGKSHAAIYNDHIVAVFVNVKIFSYSCGARKGYKL